MWAYLAEVVLKWIGWDLSPTLAESLVLMGEPVDGEISKLKAVTFVEFSEDLQIDLTALVSSVIVYTHRASAGLQINDSVVIDKYYY